MSHNAHDPIFAQGTLTIPATGVLLGTDTGLEYIDSFVVSIVGGTAALANSTVSVTWTLESDNKHVDLYAWAAGGGPAFPLVASTTATTVRYIAIGH